MIEINYLVEVLNGWNLHVRNLDDNLIARRLMPRNCNPRTSSLPVIVSAVVALAMMVVASADEAPLCANCPAQETLPSADIVPDAPAKSAVPPNDPAVQAQPRGCAEWTDSCVTCQRRAGKITCSNIGIACQPQAVECVRAEPAEEEKRGN
jgi:hypothetical protein